jgi:OmpA-OmpF porin, OOP family
MRRSSLVCLMVSMLVTSAVVTPAHGQKMIDRLKQKAKERADQRGDKPADKGSGDSAAPQSSAAQAAPGKGVWVNYDFVPGDRILFAEDFTRESVGDPPKYVELKSGNTEIAEMDGVRYLRATSNTRIVLPLAETLPERFTLEFDSKFSSGWNVEVRFGDPDADNLAHVLVNALHTGVYGPGFDSRSSPPPDLDGQVFRTRVMADGKAVKVYVNEKRVANWPNANLGRTDRITIDLPADEQGAFITNIRVAAGGKKLWESLSEKGRVATQGIFFDVGSDRIRGESTPTLKEIGDMLAQHADLRLTIEGHTDNVGNAAANQALSEKRAAAVRQYLIDAYNVDAARLTAKGLGSTKPVAPNDTPDGRQSNRRVELVRS